MMNEETLRKLTEMRMGAMAELYQQQNQNREYNDMDFDERFNLLGDYEYDRRKTNKLERLIKQATFNDPTAAIEDIEYHPDRRLDKNLILELATGKYIQNHHKYYSNGGIRKWEIMDFQCLWYSSMSSILQSKIYSFARVT